MRKIVVDYDRMNLKVLFNNSNEYYWSIFEYYFGMVVFLHIKMLFILEYVHYTA